MTRFGMNKNIASCYFILYIF